MKKYKLTGLIKAAFRTGFMFRAVVCNDRTVQYSYIFHTFICQIYITAQKNYFLQKNIQLGSAVEQRGLRERCWQHQTYWSSTAPFKLQIFFHPTLTFWTVLLGSLHQTQIIISFNSRLQWNQTGKPPRVWLLLQSTVPIYSMFACPRPLYTHLTLKYHREKLLQKHLLYINVWTH